jgi:PAS domain S-box-containing protein
MRVFGYAPGELIGKPLTVLMPESMRKLHQSGFERYLTTGERHINWQGTELIGLRKNGEEFPAEISFGELTTNGHLVFTGFIRDITERKLAEEERERLRRVEADLARVTRISTMGELTASLAHEIKQPLTAALTNAETCLDWLRRSRPEVEDGCEAAEQMVSDVRRAAGIISSVSALFKKGAFQRGPVDVNDLIREMVRLLWNEALRNSVTIRTELAETVPRVSADRLQLQQVLMNLILNGIDAMKNVAEGGELSIKSEVEGKRLLVSVSDVGVGLPANSEDQIFRAFFTTKEEGTGMGLSISRSIVESHGGRLWATANTDKGATFFFTLPAMASAPSA